MSTLLYFDTTLVGEISSIESDFPLFGGEFKLTVDPGDEQLAHIRQYIDLCIRQEVFYSSESELPETGEEEEKPDDQTERGLAEEEEKFLGLINSNNWKLVEQEGRVTKILTPLFGMNDAITWKLNLE